jgi:DNA-binding IclR family transcriptional regulator
MSGTGTGTGVPETAHRTLRLLEVLWEHFGDGVTVSEAATLSGLDRSSASRGLAQLREAGYAETIPETGRWRVSHRIARKALALWRSLDRAEQRLTESRRRIGAEVA